MNPSPWPSRVIPAQLSFLAIYNPVLGGESDESFRDQLVFYYSRAAHEARLAARKHARNDTAGGDGLRAEENEKLRQIGLAQGMVDFARSFSNGAPVDSIETEKSRIVLQELEKGWWILASIDLTRLPAMSQSSSKSSKGGDETSENEAAVEYSSREVSPPELLIQQLQQAHRIFGLHHGPSLDDLFVKSTREKFCNGLDRFWTRFARGWDVLLHGNPAADVFSAIHLAGGGELGFGVGEEEWGSGEREVLEDLARRTDGLVDLFVSRFGEPAGTQEAQQRDESLPWIGSGSPSDASEGIIFGGIGAVQRHSLQSVSLWMRQIYCYGEQAYGVKDNPLRERRKRRRKDGADATRSGNGQVQDAEATSEQDAPHRRGSRGNRDRDLSDTIRRGGDDGPEQTMSPTDPHGPSGDDTLPLANDLEAAGGLKIPPPIVAATKTSSQPEQKKSDGPDGAEESINALGIPETYMKYLTFGLSTIGKQKRPSTVSQISDPSKSGPQSQNKETKPSQPIDKQTDRNVSSTLTQVDSAPEGEALQARIARQKRQENRGHFIIGLKGDLLELDELSSDEQDSISEGSLGDETEGSRIVLRTLLVETIPPPAGADDAAEDSTEAQSDSIPIGSEAFQHFRRVRVLIYVHRPFMYCFLFENRTSSLQWTKFYKSLHRSLVPIHKPLLLSTSSEKVAQRISAAREDAVQDSSSSGPGSSDVASIKSASKAPLSNSSPIYDLIYDPGRMTLHTSIPNIPEPGTPAAEGILSLLGGSTETPSAWTRVEALNVHSQILRTLSNVRNKPGEVERTSKTSRGWWIVWLRTSPSETDPVASRISEHARPSSVSGAEARITERHQEQVMEHGHRIVFLVRKASDAPLVSKAPSSGSRAMSSMLEVMSLGMAGREEDATGGAGAGWGPGALTGGIGIDARAYVNGLLSLNR